MVKIGDLGLARLIHQPLQPLFAGDKVVVTIWYRAPELLLGAKHYNKAVDCWATGCVIAELAGLRPIFKGEEAKLDSKKNMPFQRDQLLKIFDILGTPDGVCKSLRVTFVRLAKLASPRTRMARSQGPARVLEHEASRQVSAFFVLLTSPP